MRFCNKCSTLLPNSAFPLKNGKPFSYCQNCCNEFSRNRRKEIKEGMDESLMPKTRICRECKENKSIELFGFSDTGKWNKSSFCLECHPPGWRRAQKNQSNALRKARIKAATVEDLPKNCYALLAWLYGHKCAKCGELKFGPDQSFLHIDHIIPVSKGGAHAFWNMQLLCYSCNCRKSNVGTDDFRVEKFLTPLATHMLDWLMYNYYNIQMKDWVGKRTDGFLEELKNENNMLNCR